MRSLFNLLGKCTKFRDSVRLGGFNFLSLIRLWYSINEALSSDVATAWSAELRKDAQLTSPMCYLSSDIRGGRRRARTGRLRRELFGRVTRNATFLVTIFSFRVTDITNPFLSTLLSGRNSQCRMSQH